MRKAFCIMALCLLGGCAYGGGTKVSDAQLAGFQDGKTTVGQVVAALGPPVSDILDSSGTRVLGYSFMRSEISGAAFIPVVGALAASPSGETRSVTFIFGEDGVLAHHAVLDSHFGN